MFEFNKDYKHRDKLVFGKEIDYTERNYNSIRSFEANEIIIRKLINNKFLDPNGAQNNSYTALEFLEFMELYPNKFFTIGYAVSPLRSDYRISIEGLFSTKVTSYAIIQEFKNKFNNADELEWEDNYLRCWYD